MRLAPVIVLTLLASAADAGELERRYAAMVKAISPIARPVKGTDTATVLLAEPASSDELDAVLEHADGVLAAWEATPEAERPRALELGRRLAQLKNALRFARGAGGSPNEVLRIGVKLTDDRGGWDSVRFGERSYPSITGLASVHLRVAPNLIPEKATSDSPVGRLAWACPRGEFVAVPPAAELLKQLESYEHYLADARTFVATASRGLPGRVLPSTVITLEPPEVGHGYAKSEAGPRSPVSLRIVPITEWAGAPLDPSPGRLGAFRALYEEHLAGPDLLNQVGGCAVLVEQLVIGPLEAALSEARASVSRKVLEPLRKQVVQFPTPLRAAREADAVVIAKLETGADAELLEGLELDAAGRAVLRPLVRVRSGGLEGWMRSRLPVSWQQAGKRTEEALPTLLRETPEGGPAEALERAVLEWVLVDETARSFEDAQDPRAPEARAQADGSLSEVCRAKALLAAISGPRSIGEAATTFSKHRAQAGARSEDVRPIVARTYLLTSCGP